uniref:TLC domain-containing protein n=1 Tax=viral metagenome TaxID=1070528 RepID=A0A6C0AXA6_9ZZZZ
MNYVTNSIINNISSDIIIPLLSIPTIDLLLCRLFGTKSRWFQLHSAINGIITYIIWSDVYLLVINPIKNINIMISIMDYYYIVFLHIYHSLFFKNTKMDYFHHIVFVAFGIIPIYIIYDKNIIRLTTFVGCGLPGCIEYLTLTFVKNNKLSQINQKRIMSFIYNYFRYPFSIYSISMIYIIHILGYTNNINNLSIVYIMSLIFFNGGFYNKITIENYILHKYKKNNNFHNIEQLDA